jgi:hypothetical protein
MAVTRIFFLLLTSTTLALRHNLTLPSVSFATPGALPSPYSLLLSNRLAQARIKLQYVSIMERQKSIDRNSDEYRRLDSLFYSLVRDEDYLRHEMTLLVASLFPAKAGLAPRPRDSDISRPSARINRVMGCLLARQSMTRMLG